MTGPTGGMRFGGHAHKIVPTVTNVPNISVVADCSRIEGAQFRSDPRAVAAGGSGWNGQMDGRTDRWMDGRRTEGIGLMEGLTGLWMD